MTLKELISKDLFGMYGHFSHLALECDASLGVSESLGPITQAT
jgi:hypothetical protein